MSAPSGGHDRRERTYSDDDAGKGKGKKGRRGKGKGNDAYRNGHSDRGNANEDGPCAENLEGKWTDSLGNTVIVETSGRQRGPFGVKLVKNGREQVLSLRCDMATGTWACGNASLDLPWSSPTCLVWVTGDGRRSVWRRPDGTDQDAGPHDQLPWLLLPEVIGGRPRWGSIAEENEDDEDGSAAKPKAGQKDEVAAAKGTTTPVVVKQSCAEDPERAAQDGARISAILDIRQVLGHDRYAQETLSAILMDQGLVAKKGEDPLLPAADSAIWERLPEVPRRNALYRLGRFDASSGMAPEPISPEIADVRVGRHRIPVAATDLNALMRRWMGPKDITARADQMAHVIGLYGAGESPLSTIWSRNDMQLSWDPTDRKRMGVEYELFASPFNARVSNGRYASRFHHVEGFFGSLGAYPDVIDNIPTNASVGVNPPFTDAFLEHVFGETLERMVERFRVVHMTVPVRDGSWRPQLHRLTGASFVRQFWDCTAQAPRPLGHPVLYWEGSSLGLASKAS